jgi:hypothetical protein
MLTEENLSRRNLEALQSELLSKRVASGDRA